MTRFQKLTLTTAAATYLLVVWGAVVRVTNSGLGCPDWPLCYGGVLPPLDDLQAWIEWIHRTWAAVVGLLVLAVVVVAGMRYRRRSVVVPAALALAFTGFQAYLGKITVETGNSGESVTAHLAMAMVVLASLVYIAVRVRYPATLPARGATQRFTLLATFAALAVYGLLLFGSQVTATRAALVFGDAWPLFPGGALLPAFDADPAIAALQMSHVLHRVVAAVVGVIVLLTGWIAWRRWGSGAWGPPGARPTLLALTGTAAALFAVEVVVGAAQIVTTLAAWSVALHLALGAAIWALLVAAAVYAYCEARIVAAVPPMAPGAPGSVGSEAGQGAASVSRAQKLRTYVALTKPRIIELLLVTTVPAMVLAARGIPPLALVFWTLVGGTMAAGAANAINQVPRPGHRPDHGADETAAPAGACHRARGCAGLRPCPGRPRLCRAGLPGQPAGRLPDPAGDRLLRRRLHPLHEAHARPRTSSSAGWPERCRRSSAGPP